MADWFESRFREPVDTGQLDPEFVARMRALVVEEWQADEGPIPRAVAADADSDDYEGELIMLETEDRPTGQEPPTPHRRSPNRWLLVAAAVVVVALVGGWLIANAGDGEHTIDTAPSDSPDTTGAPAPQDVLAVPGNGSAFPPLEPGLYFVDPDADDSTPMRVVYEVAEEGWQAWFGAVKESSAPTMLSIATVSNVTNDACEDQTPLDPPVGPSVDDLATALTQLEPFEVTAPPTDVTVAGYSGTHLELTVPDMELVPGGEDLFVGCEDRLHSWIAPVNGGPFGGYSGPGQTEEFFILDVNGERLVLVKFDSPGSSPEDIAERDAMFDSIQIEP